MRFSNIIIIYFVLGAVMFGGGAVSFGESGVTQFFVSVNDDDVETASEPQSNLANLGGVIGSIAQTAASILAPVWNLIVGLLTFMNWPIVVLMDNNAPPSVVVLLGGTPTAMFYLALIRLVRRSA